MEEFQFKPGFTSEEWELTYTGHNPNVVVPSSLIEKAGNPVKIRLMNCDCPIVSISFPKEVVSVWFGTFYNDKKLEHFFVDPQSPYLKVVDGVLLDKKGKTLLKVPPQKTGEYTVPDGVEEIQLGAFRRSNLTKINLPDTLVKIDQYVFEECENLREIAIPPNLKTMPFSLLERASNLTSFSFQGNTTVHYDHLYENGGLIPNMEGWIAKEYWYDISEAYLLACMQRTPEVEKHLPRFIAAAKRGDRQEILQYLIGLRRRSIPKPGVYTIVPLQETEAEIKSYAGEEETIEIPETIEGKKIISIGANAFRGNETCIRVMIPESVTRIGRNAFTDCPSLEEVVLPENCLEIDSGAFKDCKTLKRISLPKGLEVLAEGLFCNCYSLERLELPSGLKHIKAAALKNCVQLDNLRLPDGLISLGKESLYGCQFNHGPLLESEWGYSTAAFAIPASVTKISASGELFARYPAAPDQFGVFEYKIKLFVSKGSAAHRYAAKHKIRFQLVD